MPGRRTSPGDQPRAGADRRTIIAADGWKLNLSDADRGELYDLNSDPHEQHNLFDGPQQSERVRDLTGRIHAWQQATGECLALSPGDAV